MSVKWNAEQGRFENGGQRGRQKNTAVRDLLTKAHKEAKSNTFSVSVTVNNGRPNLTPSLIRAWAKENGKSVRSIVADAKGTKLTISVK